MEQGIDLLALLKKLIAEYEQKHGEMTFKLKKQEEQFIFTDINESLLYTTGMNRELLVGKELENCPYITNKQKFKKACEIVWQGKKVIYYFIPQTELNVVFITYLNLVISQNNVIEIIGHCIPLEEKELGPERNILISFESFEIIDNRN